MDKKLKKSGGKRANSGRKRIPDSKKKKPVLIYLSDEQVEAVGGVEVVKAVATKSVENLQKIYNSD